VHGSIDYVIKGNVATRVARVFRPWKRNEAGYAVLRVLQNRDILFVNPWIPCWHLVSAVTKMATTCFFIWY